MNEVIAFLLWALLAIIIIIAVYIVISSLLPVHAQTPTVQGNLKFLPQDAYVYTLPPDGVQQNTGIQTDGSFIGTIMGIAGSGLALYSKYQSDKNKKNVQEVAQTQVKIASAQQSLAQQTYQNMPDGGESIKDKPDIKLAELEKTKQKALDTVAKA